MYLGFLYVAKVSNLAHLIPVRQLHRKSGKPGMSESWMSCCMVSPLLDSFTRLPHLPKNHITAWALTDMLPGRPGGPASPCETMQETNYVSKNWTAWDWEPSFHQLAKMKTKANCINSAGLCNLEKSTNFENFENFENEIFCFLPSLKANILCQLSKCKAEQKCFNVLLNCGRTWELR